MRAMASTKDSPRRRSAPPRRTAGRVGRAAALARGLTILLVAAPAAADEEDLITDRPDFTESSRAVSPGRAQFEGGLTFTSEAGSRIFSGPELLLRYGIVRRVELRLELPDYIRIRTRAATDEQLGETAIGAKLELGPEEGRFGAALISRVSVPADEEAKGDAAPELVAAVSWQGLPGGWSAGSIVGRAWLRAARRGEDVVFPTLSLSREVGLGLATFVEWAGEFPDRGEASHVLHHGYTLALRPNGQVDVHLGVGLTDPAPDFFVGVGFTARN